MSHKVNWIFAFLIFQLDSTMSSNWLLLVWITLCCTLAMTQSAIFWFVLSSSAVFWFLRVSFVPSLVHRKTSDIWMNTCISLIHSSVSSVLVITVFATHSKDFDWLGDASDLEYAVLAISTGYFAYDLWDMVKHRLYVKSPSILFHHAGVLFCYISAIVERIGITYLVATLFCELNSVFLHLRKLQSLNRSTSSSALRWTWRCLWVSFIIFRLVAHTAISISVYQNQNRFPHVFYYRMAFYGMNIFNLLNIEVRITKYIGKPPVSHST